MPVKKGFVRNAMFSTPGRFRHSTSKTFFDDTFVSYDEERLESVLEWLAKSGKQVLLFTCQKREMKILSEMGVKNCNYIKLQ